MFRTAVCVYIPRLELSAHELGAGRKLRRHDAWIAAAALRLGVAVATQDDDFSAFSSVEVLHV
jgi:predicted nucleic acid-binding protein